MDIWYDIAKGIVLFYDTLFLHKIEVLGFDKIPSGPKIIVGNHATVSESFILPFLFKEKLHFAIQAEIFKVPFIGRLLTLADQLPVVIGRGQEMLRAACQRLEMGNSVVIYPEGRLNHGESLHRAGTGAAMLALQTGAPIVPIGFYTPPEFIHFIRGHMFDRQTLGGWQFGGTLFVNFGDPILALLNNERPKEYHYLRKITDQIMQSIMQLVRDVRPGIMNEVPEEGTFSDPPRDT